MSAAPAGLLRKAALLAVVAAAFGVFIYFDLGRYLELETLKAQQAVLEDFRAQRPLLSVGVYFGLYVLVTALSIPGAALMTLAGGAVFGLLWGTVIVSFASTIGATAAFLIARFLLRDWVMRRFGRRLARVDEGVRREGAFYLFTLRLVPAVPFFLVNLLLALTAMRAWTFFWVSQLGMLAGTVVYVNAGTQLARIDSAGEIVSAPVLASFAMLGIFPLLARRVVERLRRGRSPPMARRPACFDRNLVVIGGGSAGLVASYIAAALRAKVTLVERHKLGGDCLNTGCVPSKALLRSARFLSHVARAPEFGIASADVRFDFADVMERVQRVVRAVEPHDSAERYAALGVDVVQGDARLVSPWEVEIAMADGERRRLTTRAIVIATGARPTVPDLPGLDATDFLTSDTVWALRELPRRLVVLGGGPIGCELGQAFARFGSQVSLVHRGPRVLPREDADVSEAVMQRFRAEGVDLRMGHQAKACVREGDEKFLVAVHGGEEVRIPFDTLLVALGRTANLQGYGLEELGVRCGATIETNVLLQTNFPSIYAAGDVAGPYQFTHVAAHQAWYAAVNALFDPFRTFRADYSVIPWVTFTEPEAARVGLNEQDARRQGIPFEVTTYGIDDLDRAIADSEAHGFIKVLTVPGKDRILGVSIVGAQAGELIAEYVLAMKQGVGLDRILGTIHVYPTMAEANKYVAGNWRKAHAPGWLLDWAERFHTWRRGS